MVRTGDKVVNRWLGVILVVLVVAIVGLVVGIVVVGNIDNKEIVYSCDVNIKVDGDSENEDHLAAIGKVRNTVDAILYFDEGMAYLDRQIECSENDDLRFQMKLVKFNYLVGAEQTSEALEFLSDVDVDSLDTKERMQYYLTMRSTYEGLGDEEKAKYYQELYMKEYFIYFDMGDIYGQ